jgi:hypothetical protein
MLLLLAMALVVINVTTGCNKTDDSASMAATNNVDTNNVATNAAPPAAH